MQATAKIVYPTIVVAQQLGAICGATLATHTRAFGFPVLFLVQAGIVVACALLMGNMFSTRERLKARRGGGGGGGHLPRCTTHYSPVPRAQAAKSVLTVPAPPAPRTSTGMLEGLSLIATRSYVAGILVISTFAEIVSTIMDYQVRIARTCTSLGLLVNALRLTRKVPLFCDR